MEKLKNKNFNNLLYFNLIMKFWNNLLIYGDKEGPHIWLKVCLTFYVTHFLKKYFGKFLLIFLFYL